MKKAVMYVRVSTKGQKEEGFSIPAQKKLLKEYAVTNQLIIVRTFEETGSAKTTGRKEFNKLIKYCNDNSGTHLLVEKTDRLYRNFIDKAKLNYQDLGVEIHLVKENQILSKDSNSKDNFMNNINTSVATLYSENLSEEAIKGLDEKASQGTYPAPAPLGYKNENKKIVIDPNVSFLVKELFTLASQNKYSLSELATKMGKKGLVGKRSKKQMSTASIKRVLENAFYKGIFFWKQGVFIGDHKAIITKELFNKVQSVLESRSTGATKKKQIFAFAGIFKCGSCGCAIVGEQKKKASGKTYTYYHCTNGKKTCKEVKYLKEEILEDEMCQALYKVKVKKEFIDWVKEAVTNISKEEQDYREKQVSGFTKKYRKLDSFINKAYEDKLNGNITEIFWQDQTIQWKEEQDQIRSSLKRLSNANDNFMKYGLQLLECMNVVPKIFLKMHSYDKQSFVKTLLSNPTITGLSVEYNYRSPFDMMLELDDESKWRGGRDSNPRPPA